MNFFNTTFRTLVLASAVALGTAAVTAPVQAQELSGGASAGGAIEGGSGAPGSGVGIPGSLQNNTSAWGIGEDSTYDVGHRSDTMAQGEPAAARYQAYYPIRHRHIRHPQPQR